MSKLVCGGDLWERWMRYYSLNTWLRISIMICVLGFIKEFRPSEPFVYEYLIGPWRNLTEDSITHQVYPAATYSYIIFLLIVFLITDICRYKPLIVAMSFCGCVVWAMLLWTTSLLTLQVIEILYGAFAAMEIAYYTYIYAKVANDYYQEVSSHTRAAILAGRALSSTLGQVLWSCQVMDYRQLNFITFGAMVVATIWSLFLPPVKRSIYFHQSNTQQNETTAMNWRNAFHLMKSHFCESFSQRYTLKWSLWWALTTAGFGLIQTYVQPLWTEIQANETNPVMYNGAIEAGATVLGFFGALLAGYLMIDWKQKGELILSICAIIAASIILTASQTMNVKISYACYVAFSAIYHFMITIASSEIAKTIVEDSYGLVFGLNMFVASVLQTAFTVGLVSTNGLALSPRNQFLSYGIYHMFIAGMFIMIGMIGWLKSSKDIKKTYA